jgi:hypothetical protein
MYKLVAGKMWSRSVRLACVIGSLAVALGAPAAGGAAVAAPYSLQVSALTGPQGGLLRIEVDADAPASPVKTLKFVHVSVNGETIRVLEDVAAPAGIAEIDLGPVARGATVSTRVHVRSGTTGQLFQLRRATVARLRPDLVVAAVHAPPQTLTTRPIDVVADISELNGDVGATATLTLMLGPTPLAEPKTVAVPKGGDLSATFEDVKLETAMSAELTVLIRSAAPFETDSTNNSGSSTVEVTEHELVRSNVLVQALGGYGAQFNGHVYAPITAAPTAGLPDLEAKARALEPQLVRIFYNDNWEERRPEAPANMESFVKTVRLAQEAGATINVTYQAVNIAKLQPVASMTRFASVLEELVETQGLTNLRWVTVGNEPNSTQMTLAEYEALYRALDAQLVARGLREHVRLMGGDLVEFGPATAAVPNHRDWWRYMAEHMNDVLDAYSVHIYWNYWDIPRMEFRLKDVRQIITEELPPEARKPTYIMEMGVRGILNLPGKPALQPGYWEDGTPLSRTNIAAFQQLWFDLESAQLGFMGSVKWDAYWGKYDLTYNASYFLIGPAAEGWPLFPAYHALRLLLQTTQGGWQVLQVAPWEDDDWKLGLPDQAEKEIAAYADDSEQLTLMGLDSHGRGLNSVSDQKPAYSIGGLPASTTFNLALWNATGNGENSLAGTVTTDAAGVARFDVPLHAAFSLTTVPVS